MHVWLPSTSTHSPSLFLQAIPTRSASGSEAMTMSASIFLAKLRASVSASPFSGFGDTTVGKFPSFTICSVTVFTFSNPQLLRADGTRTRPAP